MRWKITPRYIHPGKTAITLWQREKWERQMKKEGITVKGLTVRWTAGSLQKTLNAERLWNESFKRQKGNKCQPKIFIQ